MNSGGFIFKWGACYTHKIVLHLLFISAIKHYWLYHQPNNIISPDNERTNDVIRPFVCLFLSHAPSTKRCILGQRLKESEVKYTDTAVRSLTCHTATGTHMPYRITQCYLPPGRGDIPAFTRAEAGTRLSDPGGMDARLREKRGIYLPST